MAKGTQTPVPSRTRSKKREVKTSMATIPDVRYRVPVIIYLTDTDEEDDDASMEGSDEALNSTIEEDHNDNYLQIVSTEPCLKEAEENNDGKELALVEVKENEGAAMNDEATKYFVEDEDEEFCPERYVRDRNPYFVAKYRSKRNNELHVPSNVLKVLPPSLEDGEEITFIDPQERTRIGKVVKWKDGRVFINGWSSFCFLNKVDRERDACICEFQEQESEMGGDKTKFMKVNIIRGRRHV